MAGRRMPRAERGTQLLDVADEVFRLHGYGGASMDEIAERAGVSKPVLYDHFGSKEGLLVATYARSRTTLLEVTTSAALTGRTSEERLARGLAAFFAFMDAHPVALVALTESAGVPGQELAAVRDQQAGVIAALLEQEVPALPAAHRAPTAELVNGACERLAVWRSSHPGTSPEDAAAMVMQLIWGGLGALAGVRAARRPRRAQRTPSAI